MKHLFVVLLLAVSVACVGDGEEGSKRGGGPSNDVDCPAVPDQPQGKLVSMIWPGDSVRDLVPDFVDLCATPTSPYLLTLLDEAVSWSSGTAGLCPRHPSPRGGGVGHFQRLPSGRRRRRRG